ncbi:unnamed protein product [Heligmosomoides polygyrus]|uniref:Peptidase A2 domain-containing protein n=1 Tax=Heligmosomoides polygyrus TaxID=6339 RepID=A0A183F7N9_HELPZ|nr:unnamed protein product [Heligmosomoides polygyrus]
MIVEIHREVARLPNKPKRVNLWKGSATTVQGWALKERLRIAERSASKGKLTEPTEPEREPKISTAAFSRWLCGTTKANGLQEDLVGAQTTAQVQLLCMTRTARLDTGSQVSIIPLQVLVDALRNGFDSNADVEEIDLDKSKQVYDASRNSMSFKGAVMLAVQVDRGPRHRIGLFVMAGGDDVIVLGTNALEKLAWSLPPNAQSPEVGQKCPAEGGVSTEELKLRKLRCGIIDQKLLRLSQWLNGYA